MSLRLLESPYSRVCGLQSHFSLKLLCYYNSLAIYSMTKALSMLGIYVCRRSSDIYNEGEREDEIKVKDKVYPRTGHEVPEGE